ncbi:MAG: hypothetical protein WD898_04080 [Candidatus Paceibacterota bacterium]
MNNVGAAHILQTIFLGGTFVVAIVTAVLVWQIGARQNDINEQAVLIGDFAEVFLMPQRVFDKQPDGTEKTIGWNVLIKNASAYPIYLNGYTLNGQKTDVGSSAIPNNPDSWYTVPIPSNVQELNMFHIVVDFQDHRGKQYQAEGFGTSNGTAWGIKSKKRVEITVN